MEKRYPCPCCEYLTLLEKPPGTFLICPVCYWEDDAIQFHNVEYTGGANVVNLKVAKQNFKKILAISEEYKQYVRSPISKEFPE